MLTVRLEEPIEYKGEKRDEITFTTIQPSKEDAYKRALYLVRAEWEGEIAEIVEAEQLEGTRQEQQEELLERYEEEGVDASPLVVYEFVETIEQLPDVMAIQMYLNLPTVLQEAVNDELPRQFQKKVRRFQQAS